MEDYEKKYKDALAKAREIHRNESEKRFDMEWLFPEINESEDERIRKEMITAFSRLDEDSTLCGVAYNYKKWIAWLEKQKSVTCNTVDSSNDEKIRKALIRFHKSTIDIDGIKGEEIIAWLEKQGEQKPTESPKDYHDIDPHFGIPVDKVKSNLLTVERAKEISPFMRSGFENESADKVEPKFKIGDIVCKKKDNSFCATINSITDTVYLCDVFDSDGDYDDDYAFLILEQDEYELVEKRVELTQSVTKKSDKVWSEEDENYLQNAENAFEYQNSKNSSTILWLKSLKNRVQHQEWSEEDEVELDNAIYACLNFYGKDSDTADWLKTIKERIGG